VVVRSECVWARLLLVGVEVVLGDGLGSIFAFARVPMGVVVAVGFRGRGRGRRLAPSRPLSLVPINKSVPVGTRPDCTGTLPRRVPRSGDRDRDAVALVPAAILLQVLQLRHLWGPAAAGFFVEVTLVWGDKTNEAIGHENIQARGVVNV